MKFKILDLFCGAGGFSKGMEYNKNFKTVLAVDFNNSALETFKKNFPNSKTFHGDISDEENQKKIIKIAKKNKVNMIIGGPPCQGFSLKGKNKGLDDPRNYLFIEFLKIVKELKPEIVLIENVKNIINSSKGFFIKEIKNNLENMEYIVNFSILNAKNFGVPQNRERAFIIGSLSKNVILPLKSDSNKKITVKDAISDLSFLNSGEGTFEQDYLLESKSKYQDKLRHKKLYNHKATTHSDLSITKLKMIPPEGDKSSLPKKFWGRQQFSTTWSRLKWLDLSPTIDTRFDTPSNGRNTHPFLHRAITPREAARLQSFPDSFIFLGNKTSICKQIGNAVPPLLVKKIGQAINAIYENDNSNLETDNFEIYNDDSKRLVKELLKKNKWVDHIITDPPYNISKENNFYTLQKPRKGVDFGKWDKNFIVTDWIKDYSKLLKKDGSFIIFCSYLYISFIIEELEKTDLIVKDIIIWKKLNPMPRNVNRRYVQDTEFAIWAVKKNAKWTFNKSSEKPYLRSTFETPTVLGKERYDHPTQKSFNLMKEIIKIHTNESSLIIDPFMGTGTTGAAAISLKRKFIGIEKEKKYFEIAKKRLKYINEKNE